MRNGGRAHWEEVKLPESRGEVRATRKMTGQGQDFRIKGVHADQTGRHDIWVVWTLLFPFPHCFLFWWINLVL